jgi:hypothetical protein
MSGKLFVERRGKEGDYAIRRPGSDRASGIADTQREAIEQARRMDQMQPSKWSVSEIPTEAVATNGANHRLRRCRRSESS